MNVVSALARAATTALPTPKPPRAAEPANRRAALYTWPRLLARLYEVFPLLCSRCGGEMGIIAFITNPPTIHDILVHLGTSITPPNLAQVCNPSSYSADFKL